MILSKSESKADAMKNCSSLISLYHDLSDEKAAHGACGGESGDRFVRDKWCSCVESLAAVFCRCTFASRRVVDAAASGSSKQEMEQE